MRVGPILKGEAGGVLPRGVLVGLACGVRIAFELGGFYVIDIQIMLLTLLGVSGQLCALLGLVITYRCVSQR